MGEVTHTPEENPQEEKENSISENEGVYEDEDEDVEEVTPEELAAIDNKLDALNLALDAMESKRENIHSQLIELLKANRDIRKELQKAQEVQTESSSEKSD